MSDKNEHVDTSSDKFVAEFETMDLSPLYDKQFLVAVNTSDLNDVRGVMSTIRGAYDFLEMVEEVGQMWANHMHHAKVYCLEKDRKKTMLHLDAGTINYIEANYHDIITNKILDQEIFGEGEATCVAGLQEADYSEENKDVKKELGDKDEADNNK